MALNGYWGQWGFERLADYCDTGVEYVSLAFVNVAPEHGNGYPGTNFAGHCGGGVYTAPNGEPSDLLSECQILKEDIPKCKEKGVTILLSIGGVFNEDTSNYEVSSVENGVDFADFLYGAFGPYNPDWEGPRPFDLDEDNHTSVDGFDLDIEHDIDNEPYIALVERLREHDPSLFFSSAPQCPPEDRYFYMKDLFEAVHFDALFVQFYNNPRCNAAGNGFNYEEWEAILADSEYNQDTRLFVGLPARLDAGGGYVSPSNIEDIICEHRDSPNWGGISLWDLTRGASNFMLDGRTFNEHVLEALDSNCGVEPTTTTTSVLSTTTATTTTTSASSTATITTMTTSAAVTTTTTSSSSSSSSSPSSSPSSTSSSASLSSSYSSSSAVVTTASSSASSTLDVVTSTSSTTTSSPSSVANGVTSTTSHHTFTTGWSNSTTTTSHGATITTSYDATITSATDDVSMTTSTHFTTKTYTVTDCPPYVVDCPAGGYVTTVVVPVYTTVCPVTEVEPTPTGVPCEGDCPGHDDGEDDDHEGGDDGHEDGGDEDDEDCDEDIPDEGDDGSEEPECPGGSHCPETPEQPEHPETPEQPEHPETPEQPEHPETPEQPEHPETPEQPEHPETPEHPEHPEQPEHPETPEQPEYPVCPGPNCPGSPTTIATFTHPPVGTAPGPIATWTSTLPHGEEPTAPIVPGAASGVSVGMSVLAAVVAIQAFVL
ncbi:uncharacterized protein J7T54_003551 [Emericellopsis cladophorae]|uniref:GH18 domain-containing protein n=1 Tax=Emericellopsis cladophorae TaxID=2686198 RepID=A0A9Q0BFC4_9HYPO|nr:uncharacterized protein J7T54_003551 [Emericellopsis cladophorae]KAI6782540.1 hypothetical protein J7T54_003551 [Emericellopsis cladophorae]